MLKEARDYLGDHNRKNAPQTLGRMRENVAWVLSNLPEDAEAMKLDGELRQREEKLAEAAMTSLLAREEQLTAEQRGRSTSRGRKKKKRKTKGGKVEKGASKGANKGAKSENKSSVSEDQPPAPIGAKSKQSPGITALFSLVRSQVTPDVYHRITCLVKICGAAGIADFPRAIATNDVSMVSMLVEAGAASVTAALDCTGGCPLHYAARNGHVEMLEWLVGQGVDVTVLDKHGATALHFAAQKGHVEAIKWLVHRGTDPSAVDEAKSSALHWAAKEGQVIAVNCLVKEGASVASVDENGATALHWAASNGQVAVVLCLVAKEGVSLTATDNTGATALHFAARTGHVAAIECLVQEGSDIEARDESGASALHFAALFMHQAAVECLVRLGADLGAADANGRSALIYAAQHCELDMLAWLVGQGMDVAVVDGNGASALHFAAERGHIAAMECLVSEGADVAAADADGATAFHISVAKGNLRAAEWLASRVRDCSTLEAFTTRQCTQCAPAVETAPVLSRMVLLREERATKLQKAKEVLEAMSDARSESPHASPHVGRGLGPQANTAEAKDAVLASRKADRREQLGQAKAAVAWVLSHLPEDEEALEMDERVRVGLEGLRRGDMAATGGQQRAEGSKGGDGRAGCGHDGDGRRVQVEAEHASTSMMVMEHALEELRQQIVLLEAENKRLSAVDRENVRLRSESAALATLSTENSLLDDANHRLRSSLASANEEVARLATANAALARDATRLKQKLRSDGGDREKAGHLWAGECSECDELRAKFELLEQMYQPVQTENEQRKEMMADLRKTALELSRSRQDLDLPTKRMGEIDSVYLQRLDVPVEHISLLQGVVCDPNFHPWVTRQIEQGSEAVATSVNWEHEQLRDMVVQFDRCGLKRGRAVAEEVLRCNKELQQWNPSGGYCVTIPYHHGARRELYPEELLKLSVGIDVPNSRSGDKLSVAVGAGAETSSAVAGAGGTALPRPPQRDDAASGASAPCWSRVVSRPTPRRPPS
jgi:cytohesin